MTPLYNTNTIQYTTTQYTTIRNENIKYATIKHMHKEDMSKKRVVSIMVCWRKLSGVERRERMEKKGEKNTKKNMM
jgi:hypothetical protein